MKIRSQFKDYYDYIAHIYGGGDPSQLYKRGEFESEGIHVSRQIWPSNRRNENYSYVVVAGRLFFFKETTTYPKSYQLIGKDEWEKLLGKSYYHGIKKDWAHDMCLKLKQPVFELFSNKGCFDDGWLQYANNLIPILKDRGIDKFIPPEQCYQEIAYCFGEINNKEVLTKMGNDDKIESHGFDLKQSFRHRK